MDLAQSTGTIHQCLCTALLRAPLQLTLFIGNSSTSCFLQGTQPINRERPFKASNLKADSESSVKYNTPGSRIASVVSLCSLHKSASQSRANTIFTSFCGLFHVEPQSFLQLELKAVYDFCLWGMHVVLRQGLMLRSLTVYDRCNSEFREHDQLQPHLEVLRLKLLNPWLTKVTQLRDV